MTYTRLEIESAADWKDDVHAMADMLRQLLAENDALRDDAERYRWLRAVHIGDDPESINLDRAPGQRGLDAAIDAARKKG
jgi:sirohydrochlorin ferrochelatase